MISEPFLVKGFSIVGKVVDSTGNGISGAHVKLSGSDKPVVTEKDGYAHPNLYPNSFFLIFDLDRTNWSKLLPTPILLLLLRSTTCSSLCAI